MKVPAGKMIIMRPNGEIIIRPVDVDLKRLLRTSLLAGDKIFDSLSPESLREIAKAVARQEALKRKGILLCENYVNRHPGSGAADHQNTLRDAHDHPHHDPVYEPDVTPGIVDQTGGNLPPGGTVVNTGGF